MVKVIILTGGEGSRLKPITEDINKCAIKVRGKPLIDYSLDICVKLRAKRLIEDKVIIVTGYRDYDLMKDGCAYGNLDLVYVNQKYPKCIGAIKSAEKYIDDDHFLLMLGDEILINSNHNGMFRELFDNIYNRNRIDGILGYVKGTNNEVKKTYTLKANDLDLLYTVKEKPIKPFNNNVGTGNCILPKDFFNFINGEHGDIEAGDFVSIVDDMIHSGYLFKQFKIADKYVNVNNKDDLLVAGELVNKFKYNDKDIKQ